MRDQLILSIDPKLRDIEYPIRIHEQGDCDSVSADNVNPMQADLSVFILKSRVGGLTKRNCRLFTLLRT